MRRLWPWPVVIVLFVWTLTTHGKYSDSGDEPHYLMIAHSLAFDGDLDLANDYRDATLIGGGSLEPEAHALIRDGRLRPVHDIGMPLVSAPVVRIAYTLADRLGTMLSEGMLRAARLNKALLLRHQLSLVMAFLTGLLAREMFLFLRQQGAGVNRAFSWSLLFALSPPILAFSFLFFTELPTALITLFVFRRLHSGGVTRPGVALFLGALTGYLVLIHARNVGIVAGLAVVAALAARRRVLAPQLLGIFAAALAASFVLRTIATYAMWGSLVTTPHAAVGAAWPLAGTIREVAVRLTGLLFDREYGLFAYAPVYLLALPGLLITARRQPQLFVDLSIVSVLYLAPVLLPQTNVHGWTGGWSPAARFLVPIVPLFWVALFACASRAAQPARIITLMLVALQIAIDAFVWQFPKTMWNDGNGTSAFTWSSWLPTWTNPDAALGFTIAMVALALVTIACWRGAGDRQADATPVTA